MTTDRLVRTSDNTFYTSYGGYHFPSDLFNFCFLELSQVKNHLESCEAELENGGLADDLNGAKQMLSTFREQLKEIDNLSLRTFCKGEELIDLLRHSDVELRVRNPNAPETIDAHHHIQNLLEFLHNQRSSFLAFAENRGRKLEHRLALKQLEADTRQVGRERKRSARLNSITLKAHFTIRSNYRIPLHF